jgi:hypothetical protein
MHSWRLKEERPEIGEDRNVSPRKSNERAAEYRMAESALLGCHEAASKARVGQEGQADLLIVCNCPDGVETTRRAPAPSDFAFRARSRMRVGLVVTFGAYRHFRPVSLLALATASAQYPARSSKGQKR